MRKFQGGRFGSPGGEGNGSGDVVGPASSTDNAVARFNLATGKLLQDSVVLIGDTGAVSGVTTLGMSGLLTITQGTANTGIMASTGYSVTGSNTTRMVDLAGTWNTSGLVNGIYLDITNTASSASSKLLRVKSSTGSEVSVRVDGRVFFGDPTNFGGSMGNTAVGAGTVGLYSGFSATTAVAILGSLELRITNSSYIVFGTDALNSNPVYMRGRAAASLQLGQDSATPISQTIGVAAGVGTNIAGANFTHAAGTGTGTGTPGSILWQTSLAIGAGSTAQTLATRLSLVPTATAADLTFAEGVNLAFGTSGGTKIGTSASQLIGIWGATPIAQPTISGSRADPEDALANLLNAFNSLGLIVDATGI